MPSGKVHDAITFILVAPVLAVTYAVTFSPAAALVVTAAFLFGGLMFGPDLDTLSKQYSRWSVLKILWYPYRSFFKHRSRWSHGLIFGTFLRIVYFMGVLTLAAFIAVFALAVYFEGSLPDLRELAETWRTIGEFTRANLGEGFLASLFVGMWAGAASHTFADMAGSYIKTGRVTKFL
ncbi:MAG: metal-binding protein [Pyrinomonadaceae bacterium]